MDAAWQQVAQSAQAQIAAGTLRGAALGDLLMSVPARDRDAFADVLLGLDDAPPDDVELPRGCVPYLPCGVGEIMGWVRAVPLTASDTLVDLGSGLGRVVMLAHLLSGARATGIEIQTPLVQAAQARSAALGLTGVSWLHGDAATVPLPADASAFFLYAPFTGDTLSRVLSRLAQVAQRRAIVVGTVDLDLHGVAWLRPRAAGHTTLSVYDGGPVPPSV